MSHNIQIGAEIAPGFKVTRVRNRTVMSDMANPIVDFTEVQLDCLYENAAVLSFATFMKSPPPPEEWIRLALTGTEEIHQPWKPRKIKQTCISIAFKMKAQSGHLVAVTEMMAAKGNVLVSSQLQWFGFPVINRFSVDFKPGM